MEKMGNFGIEKKPSTQETLEVLVIKRSRRFESALAKTNFSVKMEMASELRKIGLSQDAIIRQLNI